MNSQFRITEKDKDKLFHQVCIKNITTGEFIVILPELGARLNYVLLKFNNKLIPVVRDLKNENLKSKDEIFNNAKLFPFANRVKMGKYTFQNKAYELPINYKEEKNACHGFLYDAKFKVISKNVFKEFAKVELEYESINKMPGYPFCFKLQVIFKLTFNGEVVITTRVFNLNNDEILFTDGWHPYYCLENSIDDFTIECNVVEKLELSKQNIPNNKIYPLENGSYYNIRLNDKSLDDLFRFSQDNKKNIINIISEKLDYKLAIWHEAGVNKYNYLILYTPPDRNSIAVEPMTSSIDAFNNKEGLIILKPDETWTGSMGFSLLKK